MISIGQAVGPISPYSSLQNEGVRNFKKKIPILTFKTYTTGRATPPPPFFTPNINVCPPECIIYWRTPLATSIYTYSLIKVSTHIVDITMAVCVCVFWRGGVNSAISSTLLSIYIKFQKFDYVTGMVPEYMHSVCLGVVRQFTNLLCSSESHGKDYHITHAAMKTIHVFLCGLKAPTEVRRTPRGLKDRVYWKATE